MSTTDGTVGRYLGWFLVALSLGAGVIHFAHAGEHFDLTWYHGFFFAAVAWLQLSWAAAIIVKPTRNLLLLGALGNIAVVGVWVMSRTTGLPFGPDAWEAEKIALSDTLATGFEVAIVFLALAVVIRPALSAQAIRPSVGFAGLGVSGLAIAVVSTVALTPSFAAEHSHSDGEAAADKHSHNAVATPSGSNDHAEHGEAATIAADGTSKCEKSQFGGNGSKHGHRGPYPDYTGKFTAAERAEYMKQVAEAVEVTKKYPTVKAAEAAGWRLITGYVPCIAAHYIKNSALANPFDPKEPEILLFDGTKPDSHIVGLSYLVFATPTKAPEGFERDEPWHIHESLCIGSQVVGDESTSDEECAKRGGRNVDLGNLWMNHMWPVAGWESRWGLFSSENPDLGGTFGNING